MEINIGSIDRIARIVAGIAIIGAGLFFQPWWGLVGLVPLSTAVFRWCPAYALVGINTCQKCADGKRRADCTAAG